ARNLHDDIRDLSLKYGPVFTLFMPIPMVVIADYEGVKEAFVVRGDDFIGRPEPVIEKGFFCENQGVINSNGNSWRENRRQSISILRDFGMGKNLMEEKVKLSISEYLRYLSKIEDKTKVDMRKPIQLVVANVINETLFGYRYDYDNCDPLINYVEAFAKLITAHSSSLLRFFSSKFKWIRYVPIIKYYAVERHIENVNQLQGYIRTNMDNAMEKFDADHEPECFVHANFTHVRYESISDQGATIRHVC
ncbi:hypothetical protein PENTCL1PPCAC_3255, partial [Pristionchus entomophagus]